MKTLLLAVLALYPLTASAEAASWKRDPGASWVCGGVGSDERRALEGMRGEAKLELRFVTEKRGAYVAGVDWTLVGPASSTALVTARAEGPVCLIDVPPGTYRIEGSHGAAKRSTRVVVGAKGLARASIAFPDEPWDGIRASPEEKAQAAKP